MAQTKPYITGLYGCSCHPFNSWQQHDYYNKQKFKPGDRVKDRCTGKLAIVIQHTADKFYCINELPCTIARNITMNHVSCLIPYAELSAAEKQQFENVIIINQ